MYWPATQTPKTNPGISTRKVGVLCDRDEDLELTDANIRRNSNILDIVTSEGVPLMHILTAADNLNSDHNPVIHVAFRKLPSKSTHCIEGPRGSSAVLTVFIHVAVEATS